MNVQTGKFSLRRAVSLLFKLTVLYVVLWFVWRAGQPMEMAQFRGLSYYQFVEWRKMGYDDLARKYQARYPDKDVKEGMCFVVDQNYDLAIFFLTGYYTLSGMWKPLQIFVSRRDRDWIPQDVTLWNFLPSWWKTFEIGVWNGAEGQDHSAFVVYCRLAPNIPTPEQLKAMKEAYVSERQTVLP